MDCIFLFAWGRNWPVPIWKRRNVRSRSHCYIGGRGRNWRVLMHSNPYSYSHLHGGLFRQRSWRNGSEIWQKFERAYEGEEHNAYPPRHQQVQTSNEPSSSPSLASCWSWVKTQSWAEEKEVARRSWGGRDRPFKGKQTAEEVLGPTK